MLTQEQFIRELSLASKRGMTTTAFMESVAHNYGLTFNVVSTRYYALRAKIQKEIKGAKTMKVKNLRGFLAKLTLKPARGNGKGEVKGDLYSTLKAILNK